MNFLRVLLVAFCMFASQKDAVAQVPLSIEICCGTVNLKGESVEHHFSLDSSVTKGDMGFVYTYKFTNLSQNELKLLPLSFYNGEVIFVHSIIDSLNNQPEHLHRLGKIFIVLKGGEEKTITIEDAAIAIELPVALTIVNEDESSAAQPNTKIYFPRLPMIFGR